MKRTLALTCVIAVLSFIVIGLACGTVTAQPVGEPKTTPPTVTGVGWPKVLTITSPPPGTTLAVYSTGVAKVIENYLKIATAPQTCSGSIEAAVVFVKGTAQLAAITGAEVIYSYLNREPLPKGSGDSMRGLLWGDYVADSHFTVRADSKINAISDLRDKRCMFKRPGHFLSEDTYHAVLEAYGMTEKDVIMMPALGISDAAQALREGRADCAFQHSAVPAPAYLELDMQTPIRVLSLSDKAMKNVLEKCQWTVERIVKAGTYKGQDKDSRITSALSGIMVRKDVPDDLVYAMAKAIDEHIDELRAIHPTFKEWTIRGLANSPYGIYHAGAFKYYMEKGYLTPESIAIHNKYLKQTGQEK